MEMTNKKRDLIIGFGLLALLFVVLTILEHTIRPTSILFTVLKKGAIYALVAVSMNLLNGFTGLFSLGQAGFMLLGAYTYAIFTIPLEARAQVYQYFDGGIIHFTLPVIVAMILAGLVAAFFAYLIGLPVLHLKSDYLCWLLQPHNSSPGPLESYGMDMESHLPYYGRQWILKDKSNLRILHK